MPLNVGIFESSGMALGGDRRFRHQAVSIISTETIMWLEFGMNTFITNSGEATALPGNFTDLTLGVGFGQDLSTPPIGDPRSNPSDSDWLAVSQAVNRVLPRSTAAAINAYEFDMSMHDSGRRDCPREAGTARSIWLVTSPVPGPAGSVADWQATCWLRYASFWP